MRRAILVGVACLVPAAIAVPVTLLLVGRRGGEAAPIAVETPGRSTAPSAPLPGGAGLGAATTGASMPEPPKHPLTTEEIVAKCEASVALVRGDHSSGTGFLVRPGVLATNAHVIDDEEAEDIRVHFPAASGRDKGPFRAEVLYFDDNRDLAFLRVPTKLPPLAIASEHRFRRGQDVTIIGNPGVGGAVILENAVSRGVMSTQTELDGIAFDQLSVSINPGNSGGPVLDQAGELIGVATAVAKKEEAVAFSVPLADLLAALDALDSQAEDQAAVAGSRHRAAVAASPAKIRKELADASPEQVLAIVDLGRAVPEGDPATGVYRELLHEADGCFKQTTQQMALMTAYVVVELKKAGVRSTCKEVLGGLVQVFDDRSLVPPGGWDFADVASTYLKARAERKESNEGAIELITLAIMSIQQDRVEPPAVSSTRPPSRSRSRTSGSSKGRRTAPKLPMAATRPISPRSTPEPGPATPRSEPDAPLFGIEIRGTAIRDIRIVKPKGELVRYGESTNPVVIPRGGGFVAKKIVVGRAGHDWLIRSAASDDWGVMGDAALQGSVRVESK